MPTNKTCPTCGDRLAVKKGKNILVCMNKDCAYKENLPEEKTEGKEQ
jgi:ssDNA-binding Zn-finger/Zn-ribbon topoisomerase 1